MAFSGFPADAFSFYEALAADNTRAFWLAHKDTYTSTVRGPMDQLLAELEPYGPFHVFRPNKDVRFSKDKTPYKENIGAFGESEGGAGYYVQLGADGMFAGGGYYHMAADQLERFRTAVDSSALGQEIERLTAAVERHGLRLGAIDELKTAPRGYARDHPRIGLLRRKGLVATREWPRASWMSTKQVVSRVRDAFAVTGDMNAWLDTHVGPSTIAPDQDQLQRLGRR